MKNKYNVKSLKEYNSRLKQIITQMTMDGAVDPEELKRVSKLLERELLAEKDTEDYNSKVISLITDKTTLILRNAGQKEIKNGDSLNLEDYIDKTAHGESFKERTYVKSNKALNSHDKFPFTWKIGQELRANFILKTEKQDTAEFLIDELDGYISNFLSIDDWIKIKQAMKRAETRMAQTNIQFLEPEEFIGTEGRMSNVDFQRYKIQSTDNVIRVDNRKDNHDLLALKELLSMLKGENVHPLSIGPGALAKYMPELKEIGYNAIIFKVQNNKLAEIKISRKRDRPGSHVDYSPIMAAQALVEAYNTKSYKSIFGKEGVEYTSKFIFENTRYYVVVDGCVGAPEKGLPLGYESLSYNSLKIQAGEVFLFEAQSKKDIKATRLYFTPYKYESLHPVHQHGSVIFGSDDQSFQSCLYKETDYFDASSVQEFRDAIAGTKKTGDKKEELMFSPSMVAGAIHALPKQGSPADLLFNQENRAVLYKAMGGLYEESNYLIENLCIDHLVEVPEQGVGTILLYLNKYAPLNKRFLIGNYLEDGSGLVLDPPKTTYQLISKPAYSNYVVGMAMNILKTHTPTEE